MAGGNFDPLELRYKMKYGTFENYKFMKENLSLTKAATIER